MFQTPFSDQIRNEARVATMCVGNITTADQVNTILAAGRADLVALARPHLADPYFTLRAAAWYGVPRPAVAAAISDGPRPAPPQSAKDREELTELRIKTRPKTRAALKAGRSGGAFDLGE